MSAPFSDNDVDYDKLLKTNLARVFSERDPDRRSAAIRELYAADAILYEPDAIVRGHDAIEAAVDKLLAGMAPDFVFSATSRGVGHHEAGCISWQGGPAGGPAMVTGTDVALVEGKRIKSLFVFLDPDKA